MPDDATDEEQFDDEAVRVAERAFNHPSGGLEESLRSACRAYAASLGSPAPGPAEPSEDRHDTHPVVGQCCNQAPRAFYGDCKYCGRPGPNSKARSGSLSRGTVERVARETIKQLGLDGAVRYWPEGPTPLSRIIDRVVSALTEKGDGNG